MKHTDLLIERYPALSTCRVDIEAAVSTIVSMHRAGGKLLLCGNGGSAADCEHISGELLKGFLLKRPLTDGELCEVDDIIRQNLQRGVAAIPLPSFSALSTAFSNDVSPENTFAQLIFALGSKADVFLGISTSGNAENVCRAAMVAKSMGMPTLSMTGKLGGELANICDINIRVPEQETFKIQELHLPVYHAICAEVEEILFGGNE